MVRIYKKADVQVVLEQSRATNWDDMLRYLRGPARQAARLSQAEVAQMTTDIDKLERTGAFFTKDVDKLWALLSGSGE